MKSNPVVNSVIRGLVTMLVGLLLLFINDSALPLLIRVTGAVFFLPALVSMVNIYISRAETAIIPKVLMSLINIGSMAFGLWLMILPDTFIELFTTLLAIILFVFALYQVIVIVAAQRHTRISFGMLVAPLLLIIAAIIILAVPFETAAAISVVFGICAIVAGISDIVISLNIKKKGANNAFPVLKGGELQKRG